MAARIAFLGTYPPRRCGIATFTRDLRAAVGGDSRVFALAPLEGLADRAGPGAGIHAVVSGHDAADYRRAAAAIGASGAQVVSVQHEFGIYGGPDGIHLLALLDRLDVPAVTTFHTILTRPSARQRAILRELGSRSAASVVMSWTAARLLADVYDVAPHRIRMIPHGVPDLARADSSRRKASLGLAGRPVILSFGLLGPGKGYETVIEAMASVSRAVPGSLYVILGATHPDLLRREGERYRDGLRQRAADLGVEDHVRFEDRFVGASELGRWLQSADVFVTPYPNLEQIASGTLSYAMGAGLPVVSTPYVYARELLANGRGLLVPPREPDALAEALVSVLSDDARRAELADRAYAFGRSMTWPTVGAAYRGLFARVAGSPEISARPMRVPEPINA